MTGCQDTELAVVLRGTGFDGGIVLEFTANRLVQFPGVFGNVVIRDPELPLAHPGAVHNNATYPQIESIWVAAPVQNWRF